MDTKTHDEPSHKISDGNKRTASTSGTGDAQSDQRPPDTRLVAKAYRERGWCPIPLKPGSKAPIHKSWSRFVADDRTAWPGNIGILLGAPSAGLTDLDLDCPEARLLAPAILPPTGSRFGRPGAPNSHWFYDCGDTALAAATTASRFAPGFGERKDKPLLEVRSTGGQTMAPPSIHPNDERLEWAEDGDPRKIDAAELMRAASVLTAVSLLCRHFPGEGQRFDAYKAMTGVMLRCDVAEETVKAIVSVFTETFQSTKAGARLRSVRELSARLERGDSSVPGFPALEEVFGKEVGRRCREWLQADGDWERNRNGLLLPSLHNMVLAMNRLDVRLRHNEFANQPLVSIGNAPEVKLEDPLVNRLYFMLEEEFRFVPPYRRFQSFLEDRAWQSRFHPVRDYLDGLRWDRTKRIDTWLFDYGSVARRDDDYDRYVAAVGRVMLVAAVRRIRQPGCKFDEMLVLINETQGTDKSTALATLAVRPEWFTDSIDLTVDDKKVIEQMRGKWIAEVPELKGRKAEIDHIKAFLSRQTDRARLAYAHFATEVGRSFVLFGTANDPRFLMDSTGNRRFWPVLGVAFDIEALKRDVDQIWAEAATAEAAGENIRLARELWAAAEKAQGEALIEDPWYDVLHTALHDVEGKIRGADVWNILGLEGARRNQNDNDRMGKAMKLLGWTRPENTIRFQTGTARGYLRGDGKDEVTVTTSVDEDDYRKRMVTVRVGAPPRVKLSRTIVDGVEFEIDEKNF